MKRNAGNRSSFRQNNEGNVIIMTAFSIILLFALGGAALDFGRAYLVKMKTQQALDAAAIAAANPPIDNPTPKQRKEIAELYYNLNFPETYLGVKRPPITPDLARGNNVLNVAFNADADVNTNFIRTMGSNLDKLKVSAASTANIAKAAPKYNVILVLDTSDSMDWKFDGTMCGADGMPGCDNASTDPAKLCYSKSSDYYHCNTDSRLQGLKNAATTLTNILLADEVKDNNKIAVVTWNDIVQKQYAFTNNRQSVLNSINGMLAVGGTNSTAGLNAANTIASSGFDGGAVNAVVLLTDGFNTGTTSPPVHDQSIDNSSLAICSALKDWKPPVIVYTIAVGNSVQKDADGNFFDTVNGQYIENFLKGCASNSANYFTAVNDEEQLKNIFQTIATNIQKLRITD